MGLQDLAALAAIAVFFANTIEKLRPTANRLRERLRRNWPLNWVQIRVCHPFSAEARAQAEYDFGWDLAGRSQEA